MKVICYISFIILLGSCQKDYIADVPSSKENRSNSIMSGEKDGSVYYKDIDPDWERHGFGILNDSLNLDINGDHIVDISFQYTTVLSGTEYDQQTSVCGMNGASISLAPKDSNAVIDLHSTWTTAPKLLCFTKINFITQDTTYTGLWKGVADKYLGVKIKKGRQILFGWVKMSVLVPPSIVYVQQIIVKEYACERRD